MDFNIDIDDLDCELTDKELELCEMLAEKRKLLTEIKTLQDKAIVAKGKSDNSFNSYWEGSISGSVDRDYKLGRVKTIYAD